MKTELSTADFREIPVTEQQKLNGGFLPALLVGIGIAAVAEIISDWDNFKNGLTGKPEEK
ncbi:MAG TPA: hypothetical protein ENO05_08050 [Bacteroides sp.]|nr:hypothetical protein [Bacteroides sp.]